MNIQDIPGIVGLVIIGGLILLAILVFVQTQEVRVVVESFPAPVPTHTPAPTHTPIPTPVPADMAARRLAFVAPNPDDGTFATPGPTDFHNEDAFGFDSDVHLPHCGRGIDKAYLVIAQPAARTQRPSSFRWVIGGRPSPPNQLAYYDSQVGAFEEGQENRIEMLHGEPYTYDYSRHPLACAVVGGRVARITP